MRAWSSKIRLLWKRRKGLTSELQDEFEAHLEMEIEERVARGVPIEAAREQARRAMGNRTSIQESARESWYFGAWEEFLKDAGYAVRSLRKNPAFTVTAVLTLALGIGANTAMFSLIRAVLLKPLPYRQPEQLLRISIANPSEHFRDIGFSNIRFRAMKEQATSFSQLGAFFIATENMVLASEAAPEQVAGARVTANILDVLGVKPVLGRNFSAEDDKRGAPQVALISSELWRRRFGGSVNVIGRNLVLNAAPCTVIGVLPPEFSFPLPGIDIWVTRPSEIAEVAPRFWDDVTVLIGLARLKKNVSRKQAEAELAVLNNSYLAAHPGLADARKGVTLEATGLHDYLVAQERPMLWTLFGAVGFVLLIACANVASLLLARASSRSQEFAVRAALGAGRMRLVRQLLTESLLLSLSGGCLGVLGAKVALQSVVHLSSLDLPSVNPIRLDGWVLAFTILVTVASGLLFGLLPALQVSRPDLTGVLRERSQSGNGASIQWGRGLGFSTRSLLVIAQVALSLILLIGSTLLLRSVARLQAVNPGMRTSNLLTMQLDLPPLRYDTPAKKEAFFRELIQKVEATPGVWSAAAMLTLPTGKEFHTNVQIAEQARVDVLERPAAQLQSVTPGYFQTAGIAIKRGREFSARDDMATATPTAIVNETFARRFWPDYPKGAEPVGQYVLTGTNTSGGFQIIGIVADVHERGPAKDVEPEVYLSDHSFPLSIASLVVRTKGDPHQLVNEIRRDVFALDSDQPISSVKTMQEVLDASFGQQRLALWLLGSFAGMAALLALIGLYGVITYTVVQRSDELGIRRALGAQTGDILQLVVQQGLLLTLGGVLLGGAGALGLTRLMQSLLFQVRANDPSTFASIALLFVLAALAACLLPALRAARIDPMRALR